MINRKQLYINQTSSRWEESKQNERCTVIADLNVAHKKKSSMVTYLFFLLILFLYMSTL